MLVELLAAAMVALKAESTAVLKAVEKVEWRVVPLVA